MYQTTYCYPQEQTETLNVSRVSTKHTLILNQCNLAPSISGWFLRWPSLKPLTPLMMCWGGIRTTTRRVTSSFEPQVLMPSMGERSVEIEKDQSVLRPQVYFKFGAIFLSKQ